MAGPRSVMVESGRVWDEENVIDDDSPTTKKSTGAKLEGRFPLTGWEFAAALGVFLFFSTGLFCIYLTMPAAEYGKLKLPRTISDLRLLKFYNFGCWIGVLCLSLPCNLMITYSFIIVLDYFGITCWGWWRKLVIKGVRLFRLRRKNCKGAGPSGQHVEARRFR